MSRLTILSTAAARLRPVRSSWLPLLAITLLGFALRVLWLDRQSLRYDELFTVWASRLSLSALLDAVAADSQTPYLPYVILHWWPGIAGGEFALRLYAVFPGTLAIVATWRLARVFMGHGQAHLAALLMATSPFLISRSQEVRGYTWFLLFGILASYFFMRLGTGSRAAKAGYLVTLSLTLLSHYYGVFLLIGHGITWLGWRRVHRMRLWPVAAGLAMALLLWWSGLVVASAGFSVPARPSLPPTVGVGRPTSQWSSVVQEATALLQQAPSSVPVVGLLKGTGSQPVATPAATSAASADKTAQWKRLSGRTVFEVASQMSLGGEFGLGIAARPAWWNALAGLYLATIVLAGFMARGYAGFWPLLTWILVPGVATYIIDRITAMGFEARYLIMLAPFVIVLACLGLAGRRERLAVAAVLLTLQGIGLYTYYHSPYDARDDWRALVATLQTEQQAGDGLFAFPAHHFAMASAVYNPNLPEGGGWVWPDGQLLLLPQGTRWRGYGMRLAAVPGGEARTRLLDLACSYDRLWVVTYTSRVDGDSTKVLQQLDGAMNLVESFVFQGPKGLRLWLYSGCRTASGPSGDGPPVAVGRAP